MLNNLNKLPSHEAPPFFPGLGHAEQYKLEYKSLHDSTANLLPLSELAIYFYLLFPAF